MEIVSLTTEYPHITFTHINVTPTKDAHREYVCYMLDQGPDVAWSYKFQIFWSLTAVVVGLVANSLNVLVFSSREMLQISSNVYLMALAISDSMFLLAFVLAHTLTYISCLFASSDMPIDIYNRSDIMCKFLQYVLDLFSDYSAMLILAFTVERYIACYHAIRFREWCTVRRARVTCGVMFAVIALLISPYHIICMGLPIVNGNKYPVCNVLPKPYYQYYEDAFYFAYMVEVFLFRVLPIIVIAVLNVLIIIKITKLHREKKKRRKATAKRSSTLASNSVKNTSKDDRHIQLTMMLILVSTTYIMLYIPVLVCFFLTRLVRENTISMEEKTIYLIKNYTVALDISGFAINFFLYTMSGRIFRDKLMRISCKQEPTTTVTMLNGDDNGQSKFIKTPVDGATRGNYESCANGDKAASMTNKGVDATDM